MEVVKAPDNIRVEKLTRLVQAHQQTLMNLCYMYLHDRELAKDAVQETYLKAYKAIDTFVGEDTERAWLIKIALNTCRDMKRSAWYKHVNRYITPEDIPDAVDERFQSDALELADAIMRLPDKYKEVILLHYFQDMPLSDIAPIAGITKSMVSRRVKKARALLHDLLGEE
ncbi:MAG: sigma-70 family RNA polymerase sigma factor [Christensenellaceae bacterium]|nr:sigma-70 family RNA polymerase sigma factor [Christensenellaceae bacterium]